MVTSLLQHGMANLKKADYATAITAFTKAIQLNDKCAEAYRGRGMALCLSGDPNGAQEDFATAIRLTQMKRSGK
jgi:Flp pilus assembly protein TadD